jgi:hypothetical protein
MHCPFTLLSGSPEDAAPALPQPEAPSDAGTSAAAAAAAEQSPPVELMHAQELLLRQAFISHTGQEDLGNTVASFLAKDLRQSGVDHSSTMRHSSPASTGVRRSSAMQSSAR